MNDKDMLYKCLGCGNEEIVKARDYKIDGKVCEKCKGHLLFIGYVGIDLASEHDRIARYIYTPGSKKMRTF